MGADTDEVARHIADAAEHDGLSFDTEYRHWRFRRGALDFTIDEAVEHEITDTQNSGLA